MYFTQLLARNFYSDAFIIFQKTIIDNLSYDGHHNFLFMLFQFWKVFGCFVISWSFTIVIKDPFNLENDYFSSPETASNTLKKVDYFYFHWVKEKPIYQVSSLYVVVLKGQKWIAQKDVWFTAVNVYRNTDRSGYR